MWVVRTDPLHYIGTGATQADLVPQFRLMRRAAAWQFISQIHTPGFVMKEAYVAPSTYIFHMNLLDQSTVDRRRKYEFYERQRPASWNRTYLLDPDALFCGGDSLPCHPEMSPPIDLIRSDASSFPSPLHV